MFNLDIVIPSRGRAIKLKRCLDSIDDRVHHGVQIKVIVIADGDEVTANFASWHKRVDRVIFNKEKRGSVYSRNLAISASEDAVLYAVDDMEFLPGSIEAAVKCMIDEYPDGDGVVGLRLANRIIRKQKTGFYAGVAIVGRRFLSRYPEKRLFYPGYVHFSAQEVTNLGVKLGKIMMCDEAQFIHHSPKKGGGTDQTHKEGRAFRQHDTGLRKVRREEGLLWGYGKESAENQFTYDLEWMRPNMRTTK